MTRRSHVEAAIANALRVRVEQVPEQLRKLKATRSFAKLSEYLIGQGVPVGKSWLSEYLREHPPA